ncbi:hypothetical protein N7523_010384 [Penicillium sp. IBT 18751x]|nr:hypothetical protein N7523_010384 [Penicillium sp. IBT 18751x]
MDGENGWEDGWEDGWEVGWEDGWETGRETGRETCQRFTVIGKRSASFISAGYSTNEPQNPHRAQVHASDCLNDCEMPLSYELRQRVPGHKYCVS